MSTTKQLLLGCYGNNVSSIPVRPSRFKIGNNRTVPPLSQIRETQCALIDSVMPFVSFAAVSFRKSKTWNEMCLLILWWNIWCVYVCNISRGYSSFYPR
jgi:hypothetical protein